MSDYERYYATPSYRVIIFLVGFLASFLWLSVDQNPNAQIYAVRIYGLLAAAVLIWSVWLYLLRTRQQNVSPGGADAEQWPWADANRARSARWLALAFATLGFGLGVSAVVYRDTLKAIVIRYVLDINTTQEVLLTFLFLLGIVMGAYVVRNWSKKQEEFNASVTTALGAALLTAILGRVEGEDFRTYLANYGIGFALSFGVNLIAFSVLSARYSSTQSLTARALLDLLYGGEKADAIDRYFVKNFEADPESAKYLLVQTLVQCRERFLAEYARKVAAKLKLRAATASPPGDRGIYQLLSIETDQAGDNPPPASPLASLPDSPLDDDRKYKVKVKRLVSDDISKEMFRMGIAIRRLDNLEYIVAPGEYRRAFPFYGSVAGLALTMRRTIVMHRDSDTRFRSENYRDGITPKQVLHGRGFDVLDFLSYVSIPLASSYSNQIEVALGIFNVDTRLFLASPGEVNGVSVDGLDGGNVFEAWLSPRELKGYAARLYDRNDEAIRYLEEMRGIVVPVVQLYVKCLQGVS